MPRRVCNRVIETPRIARFDLPTSSGLAREKWGARGESDQEKCGGCNAGEQDCQAAGEDVIARHYSCLISLAFSAVHLSLTARWG